MVLNSRVTFARLLLLLYNQIHFNVCSTVVYYHFDRFFSSSYSLFIHYMHFAWSNFQLFLQYKSHYFYKSTWELKSIRLQNYDSTVCTFIDFKLWFTVLNDRYITKSHLMLSKTKLENTLLGYIDMLPFKSITKCVCLYRMW